MKILIHPYAKKTISNKVPSPKDYPHFKELCRLLEEAGHVLLQVGVNGEEPICKLTRFGAKLEDVSRLLTDWADTFISVDSFLQHMAACEGVNGVVLFGPSDPKLFGYANNHNVLKGRAYLRADQTKFWTKDQLFQAEAWLPAVEIFDLFQKLQSLKS